MLESSLKRLIQVKPDHAHAYNALGYSFADRNMRLPEASKLIEKALELSPEDYFIIDSLGWVLYRMGDLKGAAAQLRRACDGRPDGEIGAHLGEVLWVLGERDEARAHLAGGAQEPAPRTKRCRRRSSVSRPRIPVRSLCAAAAAAALRGVRHAGASLLPAKDLEFELTRAHRGALPRRSGQRQHRLAPRARGDEMLLSTPLGQGVARIVREGEAVR